MTKERIRIIVIMLFVLFLIYGFFTQFIPFIKIGFTKNVEPDIYINNVKKLGCNVINKTPKNKKNYFYYETDDNCFCKGKYIYNDDDNLIKIGNKLQDEFDNEEAAYHGRLQVLNYYSHISDGKDFYILIYNHKRILYFKCKSKDQDTVINMLHKMGYATPDQARQNELSFIEKKLIKFFLQ